MKTAYLVSGIRTPFAKAGTELKSVHAAELGRFALAELIARLGHTPESIGTLVDEVIVGNTGNPSDTANIARVVALNAGLPKGISAYSVHRNCASGMEAISEAALKVQAGVADIVVAGGTESMSTIPLLYNKEAVGFFEALNKAKSLQDKAAMFVKLPVAAFLKPRVGLLEGLTDPFCGLNMGQTAEVLAKEFKISREAQDQYALKSHQKTVAAQESGKFQQEIAPYPIPPKFEQTLAHDSGPRKTQTMEALAKLKPYFDKKYGTVTPGNSCPITDGAAMTIIASEEGLKKLGSQVKPLAKIIGHEFAGLDPSRMGLGPTFAIHKYLSKSKMKLSDFGLVELNEAFAVQVMACSMALGSKEFCQRELGVSSAYGELSMDTLNPNGGAIALGHPVGATGARLVITLALEMQRRKTARGLATLCIGGGQGGVVALEAV